MVRRVKINRLPFPRLSHRVGHKLLLGVGAAGASFLPVLTDKSKELGFTDFSVLVGVETFQKITHVLLRKAADAALEEMVQLLRADRSRLVGVQEVE